MPKARFEMCLLLCSVGNVKGGRRRRGKNRRVGSESKCAVGNAKSGRRERRKNRGVGSESKVVSERGGSKRKIGERSQKGMLEFCREAEMC
jgi:hypothetical protein